MKMLRPGNRFKPEVVLDSLSSAVLCLDESLSVANMNAAAEVMFGISGKQVLGQPLAEAVPHLTGQHDNFERALREGGGFTLHHLQLRNNGSEPFTVDLAVTPFAGFDGQPGLVLEMRALDRHLRISRDDLIHSQFQTSREVIRGLAHEIKNPLGGLRGAAQLLERELPSAELKEYTDVIIAEADRLKKLVDRLLGPNTQPQLAPVNIHEIMERVRAVLEVDLPAGMSVLRDYDPSLPELVGDADQLNQALLNLAVNAVQSLPHRDARGEAQAGQVLLRSRVRRQFTIRGTRHRLVAQLDVEDNGPGIEEEMLSKIFYPMVSTRADGTGLGLPIAQTLVQQHGGLIEVSSQPGRTVFSVFLPISDNPDEAPVSGSGSSA